MENIEHDPQEGTTPPPFIKKKEDVAKALEEKCGVEEAEVLNVETLDSQSPLDSEPVESDLTSEEIALHEIMDQVDTPAPAEAPSPIIKTLLSSNGISADDSVISKFEKWIVGYAWDKFNDFIMAKRDIAKSYVEGLSFTIPNATKGEEFNAVIRFPQSEQACDFDPVLPDDIGLQIEPVDDQDNAFRIFGTPNQAGTFDLVVYYSYPDRHDMDLLSRNLTLIINANPRDLWLNLETPTSIPYYKADTQCEYLEVLDAADGSPRKDIVAASRRGRSHAHTGKPRDDHFKVFFDPQSEWYVMAVADGAGSAEFSRQGSLIACDTVVDYCKEKLAPAEAADFEAAIRTAFDNKDSEDLEAKSAANQALGRILYDILGQGAFSAHRNIFLEAQKLGEDPKKYATTLLLAICKKFDFGWFIAGFWVGDGAMCIYNRKDPSSARLLGEPDEGEYSGQTRFITMPEVMRDPGSVFKRLRFSFEDDFTALLLMSDGVSDPMFGTDANLKNPAKWDELWDKLHNGFPADNIKGVELVDNKDCSEELLNWLDFWMPGEHDDRTIAILY